MIEVPNLDTIAFEALVDEGRGLIPRFAPDWTDHNLHDPGVTLLDLLAWIIDQQVYRIGFVGDAHLEAFAALLGVKRLPAVPARGLIWPRREALPAGTANAVIAAGTRASPVQQPDLAFSVTQAVALSGAGVRITAHRPQGSRPVHTGDDGAVRLDSETDAIEIELDTPLAPAPAAARYSLGLAFAEPMPAAGAGAPVALDYRDSRGSWHRAETAWIAGADAPSGALLPTLPAEAGPVRIVRLRLDVGLPRRLLPNRIALNAIPIVQAETLPGLKIGEGQDWPDLELGFDLGGGTLPGKEDGFKPLDIRSLSPRGDKFQWTAVADFRASGPDDRHFVLDEERRSIVFGNGINGRFPERGEEISHEPLDVTRGAEGNVAAAVDWTLGSAPAAAGAFGRNLSAIAGGKDAWSRDDLLAELRRRARRRKAMVTDAELLAAAFALKGYGISRAEVLARFHPALPGQEVPGARTLLLRPGPGVAASDAWLDAIDRALAPGRILGERLTVVAVRAVPVAVEARLLVGAGSDRQRIGDEARQRLGARLAVTAPDDGREIEPWPSGRPVTIAELETLLAGIDGVVAVTDLRLGRAGTAPAVVSLPLARTEVAVVDDRISISFAVER
ncbi:MAG: hypothetical protein QOE79_8 [Sphingomonadales bacterium]|nr:hypothetical protein [Sphingomonadales bacterium]